MSPHKHHSQHLKEYEWMYLIALTNLNNNKNNCYYCWSNDVIKTIKVIKMNNDNNNSYKILVCEVTDPQSGLTGALPIRLDYGVCASLIAANGSWRFFNELTARLMNAAVNGRSRCPNQAVLSLYPANSSSECLFVLFIRTEMRTFLWRGSFDLNFKLQRSASSDVSWSAFHVKLFIQCLKKKRGCEWSWNWSHLYKPSPPTLRCRGLCWEKWGFNRFNRYVSKCFVCSFILMHKREQHGHTVVF